MLKSLVMNSRILIVLMICLSLCFTQAQAENMTDSTKTAAIHQEAANPNFIHAYLLIVDAGTAFYSVSGHAAIRMVCAEKGLDYCFSFELDMDKSSYIDVFTRKGKAGFVPVPSKEFLDSYKQEGRGVRAFEFNLTPEEKQNLWRVLDSESMEGSVWTFDCTSVNCMSMVTYAMNKAIAPNQVKVTKLPQAVQGDLSEWIGDVARHSPWIRILMRMVFFGADESQIRPEDLLMPEMMNQAMPDVVVVDSLGQVRKLMKGHPTRLLPQIYEDKPCWFSPALAVILCLVSLSVVVIRKKMKRKI